MTTPRVPLPRSVRDDPVADALQLAGDAAVMRIGRVVRYNNASISVAVSGSVSLVNAVYLSSYVPILGDLVVIMKTQATWIVLGALAGPQADNAVKNGSFEMDADGTAPATGWDTYAASGAPGIVAVLKLGFGLEIDGQKVYHVQVTNLAATAIYITSSPIPVVAGEVWAGSAYLQVYSYANNASSISMGFGYYASFLDTYPNTVGSDQFNTDVVKGVAPNWYLLRTGGDNGGVIIPKGANYLRVSILCQCTPDAGGSVDFYIDRVIARKIFNADGTLYTG